MSGELPAKTDLAWVDPELEQAMHALLGGEVGPALTALAGTRGEPDRRELYADALGEAGSVSLEEVATAARQVPDDPDRLLLLGGALAMAAWEARGSAYFKDLTAEQIGGLRNYSEQANITLRRAAELDPEDATPWSRLLRVALGAPSHPGERDEVFAQVEARAPHLFWANTTRCQMLTPKWGGNEEALLAFARRRVADLPDGHPTLGVLPFAYIELHLRNPAARTGRLRRLLAPRVYLSDSGILDEVAAASDRLLAGDPSHPRWLAGNQQFAGFYWRARVDPTVREQVDGRFARHIADSGDRADLMPWGYFAKDHHAEFAAARDEGGRS